MSEEQFRSNYPVTIELDIQWGDMDAFQHLNNVTYFRYFENVRIAHFEKTGINAYMEKHQVGPILGHTECKYLLPLTWPDKVIIGTKVTVVREKRFTMAYAVYSKQHQQIAAEGSGEIIFVDYQIGKTFPIPESIVSHISV